MTFGMDYFLEQNSKKKTKKNNKKKQKKNEPITRNIKLSLLLQDVFTM